MPAPDPAADPWPPWPHQRSALPARRTLHTSADLLTDRQRHRLDARFATDAHVEVETTWATHQRMITAYRDADPRSGCELMAKLIDSLSHDVPAALSEHRSAGPDTEATRR